MAPLNSDIECWHCNKKGHYKNKCPELQVIDVGVQNLFINDWEPDTSEEECDEVHSLIS